MDLLQLDQAEGKGKEERGGLLRRRKLGMYRCSEQQRGEREEKRSGRRRARRGVGVLARARPVAASVTVSVAVLITARVTLAVAVVVTAVFVAPAGISLVVLVA